MLAFTVAVSPGSGAGVLMDTGPATTVPRASRACTRVVSGPLNVSVDTFLNFIGKLTVPLPEVAIPSSVAAA